MACFPTQLIAQQPKPNSLRKAIAPSVKEGIHIIFSGSMGKAGIIALNGRLGKMV